jgi:pimeloyl-ACP methyl ester carboxylesterase
MVGMSMGGLTSMEFAAHHGSQLAGLMMVDITPGVNREKAAAVVAFVDGPQSFDSFDALLARTMQHNPTRSESSLRRGILHNARQLDDGTWVWRYDRGSHSRSTLPEPGPSDDLMSPLWDDFASVACPIVLVRGSLSPVVDDEDVAEALRRQPGLRVEVVDGAGHSVQGDRPLELAALIASMLAR